VSANNTLDQTLIARVNQDQGPTLDDNLEIPSSLRVENRQPLTAEQRTRLDAVMAAARAPEQMRTDLRALQRATQKEKARVRIEKLLARKSGAAARMPLTGRAALIAINNRISPALGETAAARPAAGRRRKGPTRKTSSPGKSAE